MSDKLYFNLLTILIVLLILGGIFAYFYKGINNISKILIIWYLIILILNIANIMSVMKFYMKYSGRKGPTGEKGNKGPRGFKGTNNICSSCGNDGEDVGDIYGSFINDNGERVLNSKVKEGKCIFPFSYNYKYNSNCVKDSPPPGLTENDANKYGWCATKIDSRTREPVTYAYCNSSASLYQKKLDEEKLRSDRKKYMENNYGILDIKVFAENTKNKAQQKCNSEFGYEFYDQDLNEGSDGKFVYLCIKKGYGSLGISDLEVRKVRPSTTPVPKDDSFILIENDLNEHSGDKKNYINNQLFLYKKMGNKNYIQDIKVIKGTDACDEESGYMSKYDDLNEGTGGVKLKLCISKKSLNVMSIDTAFVYTDGKLYILRGYNFYKMESTPVQKAIMAVKNYPKNLAVKWGRINENNIKDCRLLNEKECNLASNCTYDKLSKPNRCEQVSNYDAVFTYGYNKKTYFFKGSKVFIYDDKKMKMTDDSPYNITDIFKGVPNNINAVFTWAKDNKTYFFKGPFYYKYNDKAKKVESGYPKRTNVRWENMPPLIDAIFSLPFNMENSIGSQSTYVISGNQSWYINSSNDKLEAIKEIGERFIGLDVLSEIPTTSST